MEDVLLLGDNEAVLCAIKKWVGPINERADTLAEEGREISEDDKRWDDRTDRVTFEVRKGNTTVRSVWTNIVRRRRGKERKHQRVEVSKMNRNGARNALTI